MYEKKCKWCNEIISVEKQCLFPIHLSNCHHNPNKAVRDKNASERFKNVEKVLRIVHKQMCPKCNVEFEVRITESEFRRNKYKKYCSIKCANGKIWSDEHKKKLSNACKTSEKVKVANINNILKLKESGRYRGAGKYNTKNNEFICLVCGKIGYDHNYNKNRRYHKNCWLEISGGIKMGSSRGKYGWYMGYWCDSSYELAYLIYCLEHNISIERNTVGYNYVYENKVHTYYPDFLVNGELVEIKNYRSALTDVKLNSVNKKITIYYKDTIKPFLDYVVNKYGKDFIRLYEIK